MKTRLISGLAALQLVAAATLNAQTYTISVGDPSTAVRVADHIGGEDLDIPAPGPTLEAYNFNYSGKDLVGLMRFDGTSGIIAYASHYWLPGSSDHIRLLKGYVPYTQGVYVVGERVAPDGSVKSAVLIHYKLSDGSIISTVELEKLPPGYKFIHVYDVLEDFLPQSPKRILCVVDVEGTPRIVELLYQEATGSYTLREYKSSKPPKSYLAVHYVRAYHYSRISIGLPAFYGLSTDGKVTSAFCFYEDPNTFSQAFEHYQLSSPGGIKGISGVQMNGSYGPNGNHNRIEMAFTDMEGGLCLQQKDELVTTNWQRFYQLPDKEQFRLAWSRDGHGTKQGPGVPASMGYFLGAWMPDEKPENSLVTALYFDGDNGDLAKPRVYNMSGAGVLEKNGAIPNTCYDPGDFVSGLGYVNNFTFITDNPEKKHTFRYGTGNTFLNVNDELFFCAKPIGVNKVKGKLVTEPEQLDISLTNQFEAGKIELEPYYGIEVKAFLDCPAEKDTPLQGRTGGIQPDNGSIAVQMDARQIRIEGKKTIASLRVLSIDGRVIAEAQNVQSATYDHYFGQQLARGMYVVQLVYTDHSSEARKVSIR